MQDVMDVWCSPVLLSNPSGLVCWFLLVKFCGKPGLLFLPTEGRWWLPWALLEESLTSIHTPWFQLQNETMSNDTILVVEKGTIHHAALLKGDMVHLSALCECIFACTTEYMTNNSKSHRMWLIWVKEMSNKLSLHKCGVCVCVVCLHLPLAAYIRALGRVCKWMVTKYGSVWHVHRFAVRGLQMEGLIQKIDKQPERRCCHQSAWKKQHFFYKYP